MPSGRKVASKFLAKQQDQPTKSDAAIDKAVKHQRGMSDESPKSSQFHPGFFINLEEHIPDDLRAEGNKGDMAQAIAGAVEAALKLPFHP